jgi:hypothetical protein
VLLVHLRGNQRLGGVDVALWGFRRLDALSADDSSPLRERFNIYPGTEFAHHIETACLSLNSIDGTAGLRARKEDIVDIGTEPAFEIEDLDLGIEQSAAG